MFIERFPSESHNNKTKVTTTGDQNKILDLKEACNLPQRQEKCERL